MSGIDMFCAADDQHRVALLVDLLQRAGQSVVLRAEPVAEPTDPCLIACTRRALAEPWIGELFQRGADVVAVRLDGTPLPGPCARVIDMQNWPARSADRKVAALVGWLLRQGAGAAPVEVAGPSLASAAPADARAPSRRPRPRSRDGLRALLVVGVLVLGGGILWLSRPEPGPADRKDVVGPGRPQAPAPDAGAGAAAGMGAVTGAGAAAGAGAGMDPGTGTGAAVGGTGAPGSDAARPGAVAPTTGALAAEASGAEQTAPPEPGSAPQPLPQDAAPADTADALAHLCNARSVEAARAWAGALNWRQRRRLPAEPCVARLLERPGFAVLDELLEVP